MMQMMRDLVKIQGGFKPSVVLPNDFLDEKNNRDFIEHYIPNDETLSIFKSIRDSLQSNAEDRARLFVGTFGTGKSDLMLMIANYVTRPANDPLLKPFFERLHRLDNAKAESIYQARLNSPPYLLVLLQANTADTFSSFILNGLAEALAAKGLEELMSKTYYRAALDTIEKWEQKHPNNIKHLQDVLEKDYRRSLERLKNDLRGARADSALKIFREVVEEVVGLTFSATGVIKKPADAFTDVAQKLVATGKYSGIMVIADEFTTLMEQLATSPGAGDSKAIDNLAEAAVRSRRNQIHFYVVSLQSFASAQGFTETSRKALERTGGRFSEYSLKSQNTEELIGAAIGKLVSPDRFFDGAQSQFDDLLDLAMTLWDTGAGKRKDRRWLEKTVVRGCFPLHPLTTFCLPRLNRVLAQNERTMFRFIWDRERGFNRFITEAIGTPENGWVSLFTVDKLFDYFENTLEEKRPDLKLSYQDATRKLTPNQVENGLEGRLLRALVMLEIANLRANAETLRHAIGLPLSQKANVELAIEHLKQEGVAYSSLSGYYQLVTRGGVDPLALNREIEKLAATVLPSPINVLNTKYRAEPVMAEKYNTQRGTWRQLTARFVSFNELDSPATLEQMLKENDGVLWYVVAHSTNEIDDARLKAMQLTRTYNRLVVAVPRVPTDLLTRLQQKYALETLRQQADFKSATDLLDDRGMIGKNYVGSFHLARSYFNQPQNMEWYRGGRTVAVTQPTHLSLLASTIMNDVFPATPRHGTKQHLKPTGTSKYLKKAIDEILQSPFKLPATTKRKNAQEMILLNGAGRLGYIKHVTKDGGYNVYEVCSPNSHDPSLNESRKVWLLLEEELRKKTPWQDIVATLSKPPYGMYPSVLYLLLAAFYRYNQDYLEIYSASGVSGTPLDITASEIIKIVQSPRQYVFNYQPLYDNQKKFLRGFAERALYPNRPVHLQKGDTASLRNRVAKLLRHWSGDVSIIARQATPEDLAKILHKTPPEIIPIAFTLMEIAIQPHETATAIALLDTLPSKLGLQDDSNLWEKQDLDYALAYLESACRDLKSFTKEFRKYIVQQIAQIFGLSEIFKGEKEVLKAAIHWRKQNNVKRTQLNGIPDGRDIIDILDDEPYNFEQALLNTLPHRWHLGMFKTWKSVAVGDKYIQRLANAKNAVESRARELGLTVLEQTSTPPPANEAQSFHSAPLPTPTQKSVTPEADTSVPQMSPLASLSTVMQKATTTEISHQQTHKPTSPLDQKPPTLPKTTTTPVTSQTTVPRTEITKERKSKTAKEAFAEILSIFNQLPPKERYILWELLSNEFDPK